MDGSSAQQPGGSVFPQPVRLHRVVRPVILGVAGVALLVGPQLPGTGDSPVARIVLALAGLALAGLAFADLRTSYTVEAARLTVRGLGAGRSVDLARLSAAGTEWQTILGRGGRHLLVLTDDQGSTARLDLAGTTLASRRRLLDALAPYIKAPAVRWEGQMDRALEGVLWNTGFRSSRQWPGPPAGPAAAAGVTDESSGQ